MKGHMVRSGLLVAAFLLSSCNQSSSVKPRKTFLDRIELTERVKSDDSLVLVGLSGMIVDSVNIGRLAPSDLEVAWKASSRRGKESILSAVNEKTYRTLLKLHSEFAEDARTRHEWEVWNKALIKLSVPGRYSKKQLDVLYRLVDIDSSSEEPIIREGWIENSYDERVIEKYMRSEAFRNLPKGRKERICLALLKARHFRR